MSALEKLVFRASQWAAIRRRFVPGVDAFPAYHPEPRPVHPARARRGRKPALEPMVPARAAVPEFWIVEGMRAAGTADWIELRRTLVLDEAEGMLTEYQAAIAKLADAVH